MDQNQQLYNLVEAAKNGDSNAFTQLYNSSYKMVYLTCLGHLKNREDAEDTTQEVFIQVYNKLQNLENNYTFYGWVKQIAVFTSINKFNSRHDHLSYDDTIGSDENIQGDDNIEILPDTYVLRDEKRKIVMDIMEKSLSEVQYQTLFMYYYDDMPIDLIARFMNVPEGTVKTRLKSAKVKVKQGIEEYENRTGDRLAVNGAIPSIALILKSSINSTPISFMPFSCLGTTGATMKGAVANGAKVAATKGVGTKVVASLLAVSVIGVVGVGAFRHFSSKNSNPKSDIKTETTVLESIEDINVVSDIEPLYGIGDTFTFGEYGGEVISWRILDYEGGSYFVIAENSIKGIKYNEAEADVTWETCTLRAWLNNDFYNEAFSQAEQDKIVLTNVVAEPNTHVSSSAGNDTQEKIYVLSLDEAKTYFETNEDRICYPTAFALAGGAHINDNGGSWWWLRSPGDTQSDATLVYGDGTVDYGGVNVDNTLVSVRPVMWVNLDNSVTSVPNTVIPTPTEIEVNHDDNDYRIGSTIKLGRFDDEDITWLVLDEQDGKYLVLTEYAVTTVPYDAEGDSCTWETCSLRGYLNDVFFNTAFIESEKNMILTTTVVTEPNPDSEAIQSNDTEDKLFLLSIAEVERYFPDNISRQCYPTASAIDSNLMVSDYYGTCLWYLRSTGQFYEYACFVGDNGVISYKGYNNTMNYGVRVAMWIEP